MIIIHHGSAKVCSENMKFIGAVLQILAASQTNPWNLAGISSLTLASSAEWYKISGYGRSWPANPEIKFCVLKPINYIDKKIIKKKLCWNFWFWWLSGVDLEINGQLKIHEIPKIRPKTDPKYARQGVQSHRESTAGVLDGFWG